MAGRDIRSQVRKSGLFKINQDRKIANSQFHQTKDYVTNTNQVNHHSRRIGNTNEVMVSICSMPGGGIAEGGCPDGYQTVLAPGAPAGSGWYTTEGEPAYCSCIRLMGEATGGTSRSGR